MRDNPYKEKQDRRITEGKAALKAEIEKLGATCEFTELLATINGSEVMFHLQQYSSWYGYSGTWQDRMDIQFGINVPRSRVTHYAEPEKGYNWPKIAKQLVEKAAEYKAYQECEKARSEASAEARDAAFAINAEIPCVAFYASDRGGQLCVHGSADVTPEKARRLLRAIVEALKD